MSDWAIRFVRRFVFTDAPRTRAVAPGTTRRAMNLGVLLGIGFGVFGTLLVESFV